MVSEGAGGHRAVPSLGTACRVLGVGWGAAVLFCGSGQAAVCGGMSWKLQLIFLQVGELLGSACRSVSLD